jgi:DNA polymerase-3 subunit alpha
MQLKDGLKNEWGENTVVPVSNFSTLQLKSLIKDVSKFYGVPFKEVNDVTNKMMMEATPRAKQEHGISAGVYVPTYEEVCRLSPTLEKFLLKYPEIGKRVDALNGQVRQISRHASGTIIGENLDKYMPLIFSHGVTQTPWPEGAHIRLLEPMGFIKFDLLGLASLRMIRRAIELILVKEQKIQKPSIEQVEEYYNNHLHPDKLNLNDSKVYEHVFHNGNFFNVFQFSESGAQNLCKKVRPQTIEDISAITAIYRPGPLGSQVDLKYLEAKEDPESIVYIHPLLEPILKPTKGQVVYQEQIAQIVHLLGDNVTLEEGNQLRKLFIKKGAGTHENKKKRIYEKYIRGCAMKKIPNSEAEDLWKALELFNFYAFNKSHSISYSLISFQCAYLLTYHPAEWACAFLEKDTEVESKKERAINAAKRMGFDIEQVNINKSEREWIIDGNSLLQPFASIKGVGDVAVEQIIAHRPFNTVEELLFNDDVSYGKLNKRAFYALAIAGALNGLRDARFNNLRHFVLSITEPRPKTAKELARNIELYKNEDDYTEEDRVELIAELTGIFPMHRVVSRQLENRLREKFIPPISEFDPELQVCWGIPREITIKTTQKGKKYYVVKVLDGNSAMTQIRCWGVNPEKDSLHKNRPYLIRPKYDGVWGFSTAGPTKKSWVLLG